MVQGRQKYSQITNNILTFDEDGRKEKELGTVNCLVTRLREIFISSGIWWGGRPKEITLSALLL